jgi:hypothetical protein
MHKGGTLGSGREGERGNCLVDSLEVLSYTHGAALRRSLLSFL